MMLKKLSLKKLKKTDIKVLANVPKIFSKKEKFFFVFFALTFLSSAFALGTYFWHSYSEVVPKSGGVIREGVVGQPRFINPILSPLSDIDRDLVNLIYSGLFKYNKDGKIIPDLVKEYQVDESGKIYTLFLKENVFFHDGKKLSADDVIFTIKTIQNPNFKSPIQLRWLGVEIEKISDYQIVLSLQNAYPAFLETLTVKIMPAHIWQNISSENFPWSPHNLLEPIGSGPYRLNNISQSKSGKIDSITLTKYRKYFGPLPKINQIIFLFFENQESLLSAAENNVIDSFSAGTSYTTKKIYSFKEYSFILPRYFALFFNLKEDELIKDKDIRMALSHATNKQEIINQALLGMGEKVESPFLPSIFGIQDVENIFSFDVERAKKLFEEKGYIMQEDKMVKIEKAETMKFSQDLSVGSKGAQVENLQKCLSNLEGIYPEKQITGLFGDKTRKAVIKFQEMYAEEILKPSGLTSGNGRVGLKTREKLNKICVTAPEKTNILEITITTSDDPLLQTVAEIIKKQWSLLGIETKIETFSASKIREEIIKKREYQVLLFGQVLGIIPDPYPFWHSSQREFPGLNLSGQQNKAIDILLEKIRTEQDETAWAQSYEEAQNLLIQDVPAIFLYNPSYIYFASKKIKGIEPSLIADSSQRFLGISDWYINTKRTWK